MGKSDLTFEDLRSMLSQQKIAPVYLLCGEEGFLIEEATDLIVASSLDPEARGFNLDIVYGSDADARDIVSHASSFPMMADRRVVVVREMDKLGNKELLAAYLERPLSSTCLVLQSVKPDFRKKPYVTAKRSAIVFRFDSLRDFQIAGWITKRVKQQGWDIGAEAIKILAAYVGTSLREIQSELDKLYIFIGEKRSITPDDVRAVVGVSKEYNVFELQNMIGTKNLSGAVKILARMLDTGESPIMVIVMLTRYFTTLWKIHDLRRRGTSNADLTSAVGVSPYFINEYIAAVEKFPLHEIEYSFEVLATADEQLKSSSWDQTQIMVNMLHYLMKQSELAIA